jgi:hypothetical protein
MTAPDPVQLAAPVDPAAYGHRPKLFGVVFWLAIGFVVMLMAAGYGVAQFGPRLMPLKAAQAPAKPAPKPAGPTLDERLADIQAKLAAPPPAVAAEPASAQLSALSDRVARLESDRRRVVGAAAAALAAASLSEAASGSRSFSGELASLEASLPSSTDLRALRPLAETGAPTLTALAAEYPDVAARAAVASRARAQGTGVFARIAQAFAAIFTVRRVDKLEGTGVDAILARAGRDIDDGDLAGALRELSALPPAGQSATADWRARAARRAQIDERVAGIRAAALAQLIGAAAESPAP